MIVFDELNLVKNPIVSVVIITYNQEQYIEQCLDSIVCQKTDFPFEVIIGEDCGTDSTLGICYEFQKQYPTLIKVIHAEKNRGMLTNYASTLSLCRGKFIAQCAGDDYWCDSLKLQKQVDFLRANRGYGFVRTSGYALKNNVLEDATNYHPTDSGDLSSIAIYGPIALASSIMFEKGLLKYIDFDDIIKQGILHEDYLTYAIWSLHTKMGFIGEKSIVYRIEPNSISHTKDWNRRKLMALSGRTVGYYLAERFKNKTPADFLSYVDDKYYLRIMQIAYEGFDYQTAKYLVNKIKMTENKHKHMVRCARSMFTFFMLALCKKLHR